MIQSERKRGPGNGQRGGVAILTALAFLLFSVPVITGSLGLAQHTSIDSRVKTEIMNEHYCGLGVHQYIEYQVIDTVRWDAWLAANPDPGNPGTYTEATNVCGDTINIELTQQAALPPDAYTGPPLVEPLVTIPQVPDYNQRKFQTFKTVSDSNPAGGNPVTYTITAINRDSNSAPLIKVIDNLPAGFAYDWSAAPSQVTLPGMAPQDIVPVVTPGGGGGGGCQGVGCLGQHDIVLALDNSGSIGVDDFVLLQDAAKLLVDTFYLNATSGAIIGVTRFRGSSESVHVMSDDATSLKASIDALVQGGPGLASGTNIVAGLDGSSLQFATGQGDRVDPNVVIFITDGDDTFGNSDAVIATASAATGAEVFAIGVGSVSQSTIDAIASNPNNEHAFPVANFLGLIDLIEGIGASRDQITWQMPPSTSILPGEGITLTFTAVTSAVPGTYCNEVEVLPGGSETRSGETAIVQIGPVAGLCPGEAVVVSKTMDSVNLVSTDTSVAPFTYTFDVDYTITVDNIGTDDLTIDGFIDLLPQGFSYFQMLPGDITNGPSLLVTVNPVNRQRATWLFSPAILVASGTAKTLKFSTTTAINRGNYWNDLLVDFGGTSFPEDIYTWPTALVSVKDIFNATATEGDGDASPITLEAWIGDQAGLIDFWGIR